MFDFLKSSIHLNMGLQNSMCKTILVGRVDEKMCYFHYMAVCWWRNDKNMPCLLAKENIFHVLQEVPALSPAPSALTRSQEVLCECNCSEWRGLCSILCFTCFFLGLEGTSTEPVHQLVLGEVIEGSFWQQVFKAVIVPWQGPFQCSGSGWRWRLPMEVSW